MNPETDLVCIHSVLLVDDEENILNSLNRTFRKEPYRIFTARNGMEGLSVIDRETVSVVLSDHRMPGMEGAEFLNEVKKKSPDTIRMMLTGYADMQAVMNAINQGEVYRFITKPWDDEEIRFIVKDAIRHYDLVNENRELQAVTMRQNVELKDLNNNLEAKVAERTKEVEVLYKNLEQNFIDFVRVFINILELKSPHLGSHCKRVAALSRRLSERVGQSPDEILDIELAAMLEDIGTLGYPEKMLKKKISELDPTEKALLEQHPVLGQTSLQHIQKLQPVSLLIRHHHEQYDGHGYPDHLKGDVIPAGSRIIAIADYFDDLINPPDGGDRFSVDRAIYALEKETGKMFDPGLVGKFSEVVHEFRHQEIEIDVREIDMAELKEGMLLASDVRTKRGLLLMASGEVVKPIHLDKIKQFHRIDPVIARISIKV
ncbi:MAG: response regulator [Nitrospirae bacterium]|nr:response regulator [Nitrospirota bacterium]